MKSLRMATRKHLGASRFTIIPERFRTDIDYRNHRRP